MTIICRNFAVKARKAKKGATTSWRGIWNRGMGLPFFFTMEEITILVG